jgi:hypothetical protein
MAILSHKEKNNNNKNKKNHINEKNQAQFLKWCSEEINNLKFPHAVWQLFQSISLHLLGGTMATSQTCCHLPGEMLNSAAKCAVGLPKGIPEREM